MKSFLYFCCMAACMVSCMVSCAELNREGAGTATDIIVPGRTNLELLSDSVALELLPVKNTFVYLYKGEPVVAAGIEVYPEEGRDSIYVKLVHSEERQGWLPQRRLAEEFIPDSTLAQVIFALYRIPSSFFLLIMLLFAGLYSCQYYRKKQAGLVFFNATDSPYPMLVILLVAMATSVYEFMQMHASAVWLRYLYDPVFSPFGQPWLLAVFIVLCWLVFIVTIACVEDVSGKLSLPDALVHLAGLFCFGVFCYVIFTFAIRYYVGYLLLPALLVWFVVRVSRMRRFAYRCGNCGSAMKSKGVCPSCGAINE